MRLWVEPEDDVITAVALEDAFPAELRVGRVRRAVHRDATDLRPVFFRAEALAGDRVDQLAHLLRARFELCILSGAGDTLRADHKREPQVARRHAALEELRALRGDVVLLVLDDDVHRERRRNLPHAAEHAEASARAV